MTTISKNIIASTEQLKVIQSDNINQSPIVVIA
jgi:hypothetical protein